MPILLDLAQPRKHPIPQDWKQLGRPERVSSKNPGNFLIVPQCGKMRGLAFRQLGKDAQ